MKKHIVVFGGLNKAQEYSRSFILCKALEALDCRLSFCTADSGFKRFSARPRLKMMATIFNSPLRWIRLIFQYFFLPDHDVVYVPYPSHADAWLAYMLAKRKRRPVIVDAFLGLYDTIVRDRKLFAPNSLMARIVWHYEQWMLKSAACALVDTHEHVLMLENDYKLPERHLKAVPVGIDESIWIPTDFPSDNVFRVIYWSTFIPLHGAEVVAHAAKLLDKQSSEIQILIIGKGQEEKKFKEILDKLSPKNLQWINQFIPLQEIQKYVQISHCCLGIFGLQEKTQRVIPYKAYQSLASRKPLITARTKAISAIFKDGADAILVNPGDAFDLSKAIQRLASDRNMAFFIGKNGRKLYEEKLSNAVIKDRIEQILKFVSI